MATPKKNFYKFVVFLITPIVNFFFPFEVIGNQNIRKTAGGHIICANHLSNLDVAFLAIAYPKMIYFMAKIELFKNRILAWFLQSVGAFAVNRGKSDVDAFESAKNILKSGEALGLFIEGTRSKTGEFLRPKMGAAKFASEMKVPVVPVCITGGGENNKVKIFKKTKIVFGEPISPDELEIKGNGLRELKVASSLIMGKIKVLRR